MSQLLMCSKSIIIFIINSTNINRLNINRFGFRHFVEFFIFFLFAGHSSLRGGHERPHLKQDFCMVLLFMYSCVFGLLFWFDFSFMICSCNNLRCICSDCSFFSRFLISLILLLPSTTPFCSPTSSNNFPQLTTSSRDISD